MNVKRANCASDESMKSICPKVSTLLLWSVGGCTLKFSRSIYESHVYAKDRSEELMLWMYICRSNALDCVSG